MIFFVTGLGRSGTSCFTQVLNNSGIPMGHDTHKDEYNPTGYWEDMSINSINASIQVDSGGSIYWWSDPGNIKSNNRKQINNSIRYWMKQHDGLEHFGAKDCRFCSTWPIWKQQIGFENVLFIIMRRSVDAILNSMCRIPSISTIDMEDRPKKEQCSQIIHRHTIILNKLKARKIEIWYEQLFRESGREYIQEILYPYFRGPLNFDTVDQQHKHF